MQSQPRNIRNEILVAVGALGALALVVIFAVVVTGGGLPGPAEGTPVAQASATTDLTAAAETIEADRTDIDTATSTPSDTPDAATAVSTTSGDEGPTESATPTLTQTRPPTTAAPTRTPRPTRTATQTPPPGTPTPTRTPVPATNTPAAPSSTPAALLPTPTGCLPPIGWLPYLVQPGDNLFRLSLRAGISLEELQALNCIADASALVSGQIVYLPPTSFTVTPPPTLYPTSFLTLYPTLLPTLPFSPTATSSAPLPPPVIGCLIPQVRISYPLPDAALFNPFTVRGTAILSASEEFSFYKVEIRGQNQADFANVAQSTAPAYGPDSALATINPAQFGPGVYQIRLTVVDVSGNFPDPCTIRVTFR